jgi:hypothetical protein
MPYTTIEPENVSNQENSPFWWARLQRKYPSKKFYLAPAGCVRQKTHI